MGGGTFSYSAYSARSDKAEYKTKSIHEVFTQRNVNNAMNPFGVKIRESRDSKEHPNSLAILLGLDVTGSMGYIPKQLIANGLPTFMQLLLDKGISDPQVLFCGIGDHEVDDAPLQVGQFESSDELLEHWLKHLWLEGGGGANYGESYPLAWYFAANHTDIDCWAKRKQKGILFTIGDEPFLKEIPKEAVKKFFGAPQAQTLTALEALSKAQEKYAVYHLHIKQGSNGGIIDERWQAALGQNLVLVSDYNEVPRIMAEIVVKEAGRTPKKEQASPTPEVTPPVKETEIIL